MKALIILLLVALAYVPAFSAVDQRVKVMTLGVFHFEFPNLDLSVPSTILTSKRGYPLLIKFLCRIHEKIREYDPPSRKEFRNYPVPGKGDVSS